MKNDNNYIEKIKTLISKINKNLINFDDYIEEGKDTPIQITSEYLTKIEENSWAKNVLIDSINNNTNYKIIEENENILICDDKKSLLAIKVYSSPFIFDKYQKFMLEKKNFYASRALLVKDKILSMHYDLLKKKNNELLKLIEAINRDNVDIISFKLPTWKTSVELEKVAERIKELDESLVDGKNIKFLSIDISTEDLLYSYNFIKNKNIPYYYISVFFDKAFIISFERVLDLISSSDLEDSNYYIEKTNNNFIIKIKPDDEDVILENIEFPKFINQVKELENGMIIPYSILKNSNATINKVVLYKLLQK